uniref:Uncharacterized protein n=1 Tax=Kalanchoe fedtschenkoi TaxID=63787 RepID=A0A7N0VE05_KALFE
MNTINSILLCLRNSNYKIFNLFCLIWFDERDCVFTNWGLWLNIKMRRREERRRRLHEALLDMLYPPPSPLPASSPPPTVEVEINDDEARDRLVDQIPDELDEERSSGPSSEGGGDGKLTRAQRKRLRKRKLREDSVRRGNMIGPLLQATAQVDDPQGVRPNAPHNCNLRGESEEPGIVRCGSNIKVKHRRRARKLAKTKKESVNAENQGGLSLP